MLFEHIIINAGFAIDWWQVDEDEWLNANIAAVESADNACKKEQRWTHPIQNWNLTLSQLTIHFPDRLDGYISL